MSERLYLTQEEQDQIWVLVRNGAGIPNSLARRLLHDYTAWEKRAFDLLPSLKRLRGIEELGQTFSAKYVAASTSDEEGLLASTHPAEMRRMWEAVDEAEFQFRMALAPPEKPEAP